MCKPNRRVASSVQSASTTDIITSFAIASSMNRICLKSQNTMSHALQACRTPSMRHQGLRRLRDKVWQPRAPQEAEVADGKRMCRNLIPSGSTTRDKFTQRSLLRNTPMTPFSSSFPSILNQRNARCCPTLLHRIKLYSYSVPCSPFLGVCLGTRGTSPSTALSSLSNDEISLDRCTGNGERSDDWRKTGHFQQ